MNGWTRHALRDAGIVALTLALWRVEAGLRGEAGAAPAAAGLLAGTLTAVCGFLLHEWGHLLGARLGRGAVHPPRSPLSPFLFRFDSDRNGRGAFLAMSLGGFAASALGVAVLLAALPRDALVGQLALALTGLGVVATVVLELPPFWRVLRGGPIPRGAAYESSGHESRSAIP
jgi:hypothetical protein